MAEDTTAAEEMMVALAKERRPVLSLARELAFTEAHRAAEGQHPYAREAACLRPHVEGLLTPMEDGDWFAGRFDRPLVGVDPEHGDLVEGAFYVCRGWLQNLADDGDADAALRGQAAGLLDYWRGRDTYSHCRAAFPELLRKEMPLDDYYTGRAPAYPMFGLGGPCIDYGRLLRLGIGGLRAEVRARLERCAEGDADGRAFLDCVLTALELFSEAALRYSEEARAAATQATDPALRQRYALIAESTAHIAGEPPETYHQAAQLLWLYSLVSLVKNYGRTDVLLGSFLARDLDSGRLTHEEALEMTAGLWRLMNSRRNNNFNSRVVIGGLGRPNEADADRFALLAIEAQGVVRDIMPQLTLRCYEGQSPELLARGLDLLATGYTFPMLYNDDANVPGVERAFGVPREAAEQYYPYGCGEYVIDGQSLGSPDAALNVAKVLNITLHDGHDPLTGERCGLSLGGLRDFATFEELRNAFARQVGYYVDLLGQAQDIIYRLTGREAALPYLSLLFGDCVERARPVLAGGVRWLGGTLESFGNNTTADSLTAMKRVVYDEKSVDAGTLMAALDADFAGHERVRRLLMRAPKYGNDEPEADEMSLYVNQVVCESCKRQALYTGLDTFLAVMVNNGDSVTLGKGTAATADGRRAHMPLSNGNQPSAGADTAGPTALLNSMAKLDPGLHAGAVHNLKLSRTMMRQHRAEAEALIAAYFARGGTQLMLTVTDRGELERAMEKPEEYGHLIVRVGGYSERFINLPRDIQTEVIARTLY